MCKDKLILRKFNMMVNIVKAGADSLKVIHDMAQVVFRHTYKDILSSEQMEYMMDMMYSMPNLHKQLEEGHCYYIAYRGGVPCGYVSVQHEGKDDEGVEIYHLHKIYVMPDAQGSGVGMSLFNTAVEHVRAKVNDKPARIELNVNKFNSSVNFYLHIGMRVLLEEDFPIGNGFYKTDYIMGLDL